MSDTRKMNNVLAARLFLNSLPQEVRRLLSREGNSASLSEIWSECGFPTTLTYDEFSLMYERNGPARRIVEAPCEAVWNQPPLLKDTEAKDQTKSKLVSKWNKLVKKLKVFHYLNRADIVSGIGEFGILVLGFKDGQTLETQVRRGAELIYLSPYSRNKVTIKEYETDTSSPRFGKPLFYQVSMTTSQTDLSKQAKTQKVHWTRVLHLAEGLREDDVNGTPRLKVVYNYLHNLEKIVGGSGEMFWKGAFPGTAWIMPPDADELTETQTEALKTEIEDYHKHLSRYVKVQGLEPKQLAPNISEPTAFFMINIQCISAAKKIPLRILIGSETGEMSSAQDEKTWAHTITERRTNYCEPIILDALMEHLQEMGSLPEGEYEWVWPDLYAPSKKDRATIAETQSRVLTNYVSAPGSEMLVPPEQFLQFFLDMTPKQIEEIKDSLTEMGVSWDDLPEIMLPDVSGEDVTQPGEHPPEQYGTDSPESGKARKKAAEKAVV